MKGVGIPIGFTREGLHPGSAAATAACCRRLASLTKRRPEWPLHAGWLAITAGWLVGDRVQTLAPHLPLGCLAASSTRTPRRLYRREGGLARHGREGRATDASTG